VLPLVLLFVLAATSASAQEPPLPQILVARQLAEAEGLEVGDVVELSADGPAAPLKGAPYNSASGAPYKFQVAGIYEPTPDPARLGEVPREVRLHLPDLLRLTREPSTPEGAEHVEGINLALVDPNDALQFARDVANRMPGVNARRAVDAAGASGPFLVLERFHLAIAIVTIVAATMFLLALTIMLVDERRETVGVLRLIGLSVRRILVQVLLEGLLIATAGALFGLVLAVASESLINQFFQWRYDTALVFVRVTPSVAAKCIAIAVPLGAAATVLASWALMRRSGLRLARR
jgi:putative ABC transport system permease protein